MFGSGDIRKKPPKIDHFKKIEKKVVFLFFFIYLTIGTLYPNEILHSLR